MQNAIEASGLTKYYDDFLAVDHISFNVEKGEIFGFLGPNGACMHTTLALQKLRLSLQSKPFQRVFGKVQCLSSRVFGTF